MALHVIVEDKDLDAFLATLNRAVNTWSTEDQPRWLMPLIERCERRQKLLMEAPSASRATEDVPAPLAAVQRL